MGKGNNGTTTGGMDGLKWMALIVGFLLAMLVITGCGGGGGGATGAALPSSGGSGGTGGGGEQPPTNPPSMLGFTPSSGPVGSSIDVSGTNLGTITGTAKINGTTATVNSWSPTLINIQVPAGTITGKISITDSQNRTVQSATDFTVTIPAGNIPRIDSLNPVSGNVGTVITLTGQYFTGVTSAKVNGVGATSSGSVAN